MMTVMEILVSNMGRAIRADVRSKDMSLPQSQRDFHAGRREAYLQNIAQICGLQVKDIRESVLSESHQLLDVKPYRGGTVTGRLPRETRNMNPMMEDD